MRRIGVLMGLAEHDPEAKVGNADPISSGFVESLARPGGNLTGFLLYEESMTGKWLAMLKEIAPTVTRIALVSNPKTIPYDYFLRGAEAAAPSVAVQIVPSRVENAADIEHAIESFARVPNGGMLMKRKRLPPSLSLAGACLDHWPRFAREPRPHFTSVTSGLPFSTT
jgi:putative ABC transport system substrate-binding protein